MNKSHPLANDPHITFEKLTQYTEIVYGDFRNPSLDEKELRLISKNKLSPPRKTINVYERGTMLSMLFNIHGSYFWTGKTHPELISRNNIIEGFCKDVQVEVFEFIILKDNPYSDENLDKLKNLIIESRAKYIDEQF